MAMIPDLVFILIVNAMIFFCVSLSLYCSSLTHCDKTNNYDYTPSIDSNVPSDDGILCVFT